MLVDSPADPPAKTATRAKPARKRKPVVKTAARKSTVARPAADPMQWWNALTQQFQHIAANALRETSSQAAALAQPAVNSKTVDASQADTEMVKRARKPPAARKKAPVRQTARKSARGSAAKTAWPLSSLPFKS
jgi:hypothetical protein